MAKKTKQPGPPAGRRNSGIEWIGGIASLPAFVTGEGQPYRPEVLMWIGPDGGILGSLVDAPGELLARAGDCLRDTIKRPMYGRAHAPDRVRVASSQLARVLGGAHPAIDVVCAPTPELDEVLDMMSVSFGAGAPEFTYAEVVAADGGPQALKSFFQSAAELFRAAPWKRVPGEQGPFSVSIAQLDVQDAALSIIGQLGESYGMLLFAGLAECDAFAEQADALDRGVLAPPPYRALNFERGRDLDASLRKEFSANGWEVAGPSAYPVLIGADTDELAKPPTVRDLLIFEAICRALVELLREPKTLERAWSGLGPVERTVAVRVGGQDLEVTLCIPYVATSTRQLTTRELLARLRKLGEAGGSLDPYARAPLEDELLQRFAAAPEGKKLDGPSPIGMVMQFAADYFADTIATLQPQALRDIIFVLIPREVSFAPVAARWIIVEMRALYRFLKRECDLPQADACLRVLAGSAVSRLQDKLSDSRNFGQEKLRFLSGADADPDLFIDEEIDDQIDYEADAEIDAELRANFEAELDDWPAAGNPPALPGVEALPWPGEPVRRAESDAAARARKRKRKAARQARKKRR